MTIYSAKKKSKQWESVYSILHQVRNFSCFQACQNKWRFTVQNVDYIYKGCLVFIFESENLKRPRNDVTQKSSLRIRWKLESQSHLKSVRWDWQKWKTCENCLFHQLGQSIQLGKWKIDKNCYYIIKNRRFWWKTTII